MKLSKNYKSKKQIYLSKYFDRLYFFGSYNGIIKERIIEYKFNENAFLYKCLAEVILTNNKIANILKNYDAIISVPMYKNKLFKRGYNQTELIAKEISKNIDNLSFLSDVLEKTKNNSVQSKLNKEQRILNVRQVYSVKNSGKLKGRTILLFDDIYTTGSTLNECAKMLIENGAITVDALTIVKD